MRKQFSFLSPENINFIIFKLRSIYPANKHADIQENIPYVAHDWFRKIAVNLDNQFVGGTDYLNQAFLRYLLDVRMFMEPIPDVNPSYSGPIMDPYIPNQDFQNVSNDMFYDSQKRDYNIRRSDVLSGINRELDESTIGGVPIKDHLLDTTMGYLATEISRNKARKVKAPNLTWGVKRQCNDDFRTCEHPALPRAKFTLPRDYYESAPKAEYWMGQQTCSTGPCVMKKYTQWGVEQACDIGPQSADCGNPRMSQLLLENAYKYPNYAYYRKDFIPSVSNTKYGAGPIAGIASNAALNKFSHNQFGTGLFY